jgi:hypothetical protein
MSELHASPLRAVAVGEATGKVGSEKVGGAGKGVFVGSGVGGTWVGVGWAAWVCAAIVEARATAEAKTCAWSGVGVPFGPQAAKKIAIAASRGKTFFIRELSLSFC